MNWLSLKPQFIFRHKGKTQLNYTVILTELPPHDEMVNESYAHSVEALMVRKIRIHAALAVLLLDFPIQSV